MAYKHFDQWYKSRYGDDDDERNNKNDIVSTNIDNNQEIKFDESAGVNSKLANFNEWLKSRDPEQFEKYRQNNIQRQEIERVEEEARIKQEEESKKNIFQKIGEGFANWISSKAKKQDWSEVDETAHRKVLESTSKEISSEDIIKQQIQDPIGYMMNRPFYSTEQKYMQQDRDLKVEDVLNKKLKAYADYRGSLSEKDRMKLDNPVANMTDEEYATIRLNVANIRNKAEEDIRAVEMQIEETNDLKEKNRLNQLLQTYKEQEEMLSYIGKGLQIDKGAVQGVLDNLKFENIPIAGSIKSAINSWQALKAWEKYERGEQLSTKDRKIIEEAKLDYFKNMVENKSLGYGITSGVMVSLPHMIEIAIALAEPTEKGEAALAAKAGLSAKVAQKSATAIVGEILKDTAKITFTVGLPHIAQNTFEYQTPKYEYDWDKNDFEKTEDGKGFVEALAKSVVKEFGNNLIEVGLGKVVEGITDVAYTQVGKMIGRDLGNIGKGTAWEAIREKGGWNGWLGEFVEEIVQKAWEDGVIDRKEVKFTKEELITIGGSIFIMQGLLGGGVKLTENNRKVLEGKVDTKILNILQTAAKRDTAGTELENEQVFKIKDTKINKDNKVTEKIDENLTNETENVVEGKQTVLYDTLYRGSQGELEQVSKEYKNVKKVDGDQKVLLKELVQQGEKIANSLLFSDDGKERAKIDYGKTDYYLQQVLKDKYDAIEYRRLDLPSKQIEIHDLQNNKFYALDKDLANIYANQNRGEKYEAKDFQEFKKIVDKAIIEKKSKTESGNFYIYERGKFRQINSASSIYIDDDIDTFIYKDRESQMYDVVEGITGMRIGSGLTQQEAIADTNANLDKIGRTRFFKKISEFKKNEDKDISPRYRKRTEIDNKKEKVTKDSFKMPKSQDKGGKQTIKRSNKEGNKKNVKQDSKIEKKKVKKTKEVINKSKKFDKSYKRNAQQTKYVLDNETDVVVPIKTKKSQAKEGRLILGIETNQGKEMEVKRAKRSRELIKTNPEIKQVADTLYEYQESTKYKWLKEEYKQILKKAKASKQSFEQYIANNNNSYLEDFMKRWEMTQMAIDQMTKLQQDLINKQLKKEGYKIPKYRVATKVEYQPGEILDPLITLHGITPSKLKAANKLGGLVGPSVAITKPQNPLQGYGEILLLGGRDLMDPQKNSLNKLYSHDVYSPRVPSPQYDINKSKWIEIYNSKELTEAFETVNDFKEYLASGIEENNARQGLEDKASSSRGMKYLYLTKQLKQEIDPSSTTNELSREIEKSSSGIESYYDWITSYFDGIFGEAYLLKGKKKLPYTMENILEVMFKSGVKGQEDGFLSGVGRLKAFAAKDIKSVEEAKKQFYTTLVSEDEKAALVDKQVDDLFRLSESLYQYSQAARSGVEYNWGSNMSFESAVADYAKGAKTVRGFLKAFEKNGYDFQGNTKIIESTKQWADDLFESPTSYLEGKLKRAVGIGEFEGAIVAERLRGTETEQILRDAGIQRISWMKDSNSVEEKAAIIERDFSDVRYRLPGQNTDDLITDKLADIDPSEFKELSKKIFGDENVQLVKNILSNKDALGAYLNRLIQIKEGHVDSKNTFFHEAVHKAFDLFLTEDEKSLLLKEAKARINKKVPKQQQKYRQEIQKTANQLYKNSRKVVSEVGNGKRSFLNDRNYLNKYLEAFNIKLGNLWSSFVQVVDAKTQVKTAYFVDGLENAIHANSLIDSSEGGTTIAEGKYYHVTAFPNKDFDTSNTIIGGIFDPVSVPYSEDVKKAEVQRAYKKEFGLLSEEEIKYEQDQQSKDISDLEAEEWLAENIINYINESDKLDQNKTFIGKIKDIIDKFIERLFSGVESIQDINEFYEKLLSGQLKNRKRYIEQESHQNLKLRGSESKGNKLSKEQKIIIAKSVYVLNKRAKFFRDVSNEISSILSGYKVPTESPTTIRQYLMKIFKKEGVGQIPWNELKPLLNATTILKGDSMKTIFEANIERLEWVIPYREKQLENLSGEQAEKLRKDIILEKRQKALVTQKVKKQLEGAIKVLRQVQKEIQEQKDFLYDQKDLLMSKLQAAGLEPIGYHTFPFFNRYLEKDIGRDYAYFEIEGFGFHIPMTSSLREKFSNIKYLGRINEQISSELGKNVGITLEEALQNIQDFLGDNSKIKYRAESFFDSGLGIKRKSEVKVKKDLTKTKPIKGKIYDIKGISILPSRKLQKQVEEDLEKGLSTPATRAVTHKLPVIETTGKIKDSRAFSKIRSRYEGFIEVDPQVSDKQKYQSMTLVDITAKAMNFVKQYSKEARLVTFGIESAPEGTTDIAVSLAYAESMFEQGNWKEALKADKALSLKGTRYGQEIVSFKGRVNENSPMFFVDKVLDARRLQSISRPFKKATFKVFGEQKLKQTKKIVKTLKDIKLQKAEDFINKLIC